MCGRDTGGDDRYLDSHISKSLRHGVIPHCHTAPARFGRQPLVRKDDVLTRSSQKVPFRGQVQISCVKHSGLPTWLRVNFTGKTGLC